MVRNSLINTSTIFLCLIPLALLSGPFLPDLLLTLIVIIFLFISIREKLWKYFNNKFFLFFSIFNLYFILRSVLSEYPLLSLESSLFYFRFSLFALAVWFLIDNNKQLIKYFAITTLVTLIVALADGVYQYIYDINIFGIFVPGVTRMTLLFNDKMILGGYLARLFPLILALLIFNIQNNKSKIILLSILIIVTDVLVYATGERTALFLLLLSTCLFIFFISSFRMLRFLTLLLSILIISLITFSNSELRERNIEHTIEQVYPDGKFNYFSPQHEGLYISAWNMFVENPIFGVGPKLFRIYCSDEKYAADEYECSTHPHNTYIQFLAELGIFGFIFLISISIYVAYKSIEKFRSIFNTKINSLSDYQMCLMISFILTLWPIIPTQAAFNNWISIIYFLPIGFYLHSIYSSKE